MPYWIGVLLVAALQVMFVGDGQCADVPLTSAEIHTFIIGQDVEQGDMLFNFGSDGSYSTSNGVSGGIGRYSLKADGRVCWTRGDGGSGCFLYYRRGQELRVRRADPLSQFDIGPAFVHGARPVANTGQSAIAATSSAAGITPPFGNWVFLDNGTCDTMGQHVEISPNRIVVDFAGELVTYTEVFVQSCKKDICTFGQKAGNGIWTTRQVSPTHIVFRGPHGSAGSERSHLLRAELCR